MAVTETMQTFVVCIALLLVTYATTATTTATATTEAATSTQSSSSTQLSIDSTSVTTPTQADTTTPTIKNDTTTTQEGALTTSTEAAETRTNSPVSDVTSSTATAEDATSTTTTSVTTTTTSSTQQQPTMSNAQTVVTTTFGENVTTTSTTATTTTTAPSTTAPPGSIDLTDTFFDMILPVMFNNTFQPNLTDSSSDTFFEYSNEIRRKINLAFADCPGFDNRRTTVFEFINGSIIANYSTSYKAEFVLLTFNSNALITSHIQNVAFQLLKNAPFGLGLAVVGNYLDTNATAEVHRYNETFAKYRSEPCSYAPKCSPCYKCSSATAANTLQCVADCSSPSQTCYVTSDLTTGDFVEECGCSVNYLLFAGTCVHQNLIIGVFAGVGGALVVIFFITLVVCCHYRKKSSKKDSNINSSGSLMRLDSGFDRNVHATDSNNSSEEDSRVTQQTAATRQVDATDCPSKMKVDAEQSAYPPVDYLPEEVRQSAEYRNFCPHLENIDSHTEVKIKRPTLYEQVPTD